jgi:RimJ/RimL family protein N-acetyltransferase
MQHTYRHKSPKGTIYLEELRRASEAWFLEAVSSSYRSFLDGAARSGELNAGLARRLFEDRIGFFMSQVEAGRGNQQAVVEEASFQGAIEAYLELLRAPFCFHKEHSVASGENSEEEMTNEWTEQKTLTLADGTRVPVREVWPEDAPALQRLFDRLSEHSVRLRYFGPMDELSDEKAQFIAEVDGTGRYALVALDPDDEDEIVALVGYDRGEDTHTAEYAALVEDRVQGRGLGLSLTRFLIEAARERDIRCFHALVLPENKQMLQLLRSLDLPENESQDDGVRRIDIDLLPNEAA